MLPLAENCALGKVASVLVQQLSKCQLNPLHFSEMKQFYY